MATTVNIHTLLDAAVHFGHQTRRWNPKMKPYIFTDRNGIYIIDLKQTLIELDKAYTFVKDLASKGGTLLFVGTKKQAQEPISSAAERCGMPYVNARWLGGMLTNFVTIRSRVTHMEDLEAKEADGRMAALPKKEQILLRKELGKLQANLNGVRAMKAVPQAVFVVDTKREEIAIHEAHRLGIPVIGIIDTNADPDEVDYGIPANDDAIRSVSLLCDVIADAVSAGASQASVSEEEMSGEAQSAPVAAAEPVVVEAGSAQADAAETPVAEIEAEVAETVEEAAGAPETAPAGDADAVETTEAAEATDEPAEPAEPAETA
jgi:small subunit ribosomal protein S2